MDISVSRLNGRLASKLPPELPLGLVFVVGTVVQVDETGFILAEAQHRLSCRVEESIQIAVGDEVRASGHLMFDSQRLRYYLLTRDIEIVSSEPLGDFDNSSRELLAEEEGLLTALAAVKVRAAVSHQEVASDDLPTWVQKLAPPELQTEETDELEHTAHPTTPKAELDAELVALLSNAMDSEEEMELTPELLAPYVPEASSQLENEVEIEAVEEETAASIANLSTSYQPANRQDTDWLIILLIISFFILTIAAVVTIVLLLI